MQLQGLTDTGLLMAGIFLSISCVYMLVMLGILPKGQPRISLYQGRTGSAQKHTRVFNHEGDRGMLQGCGTRERLPVAHQGDSSQVGFTNIKRAPTSSSS